MRNPARYRHGTCRLRRRRPALAALAAGLILSVLAALGGGGGAATAGEAGADDPSKDRRNWISFEPIGEPFLHTLFLRRAEIEIVEPELATGEMLEYLPAGAATPIDWRELYFVKRAMPRAEILDHLAHGRWDALFDPGNRPSDLDDAPGLVVTDPRWTAINRRCPGILLAEEAAGPEGLKLGVNVVDGKLRMAPILLQLYKADLDQDGVRENVLLKHYVGINVFATGKWWDLSSPDFERCDESRQGGVGFADNVEIMRFLGRPYLVFANESYGRVLIDKTFPHERDWFFYQQLGHIYGVTRLWQLKSGHFKFEPWYEEAMRERESKMEERRQRK